MSPKSQEKVFKKEYAFELIRIADGDYKTALAIAKDSEARLENAFFMLQQCVEKAVKSVLVYQKVSVPLVHDLGALLAKLPAESACPHGYELNELNQFASVRRYEDGQFQMTLQEFHEVKAKVFEVLQWAQKVIQ